MSAHFSLSAFALSWYRFQRSRETIVCSGPVPGCCRICESARIKVISVEGFSSSSHCLALCSVAMTFKVR